MDEGRSGAARVHVECSSQSPASGTRARARAELRYQRETRRRSEGCKTHRARARRGACCALKRTGATCVMTLIAGAPDAMSSRAMTCEYGQGCQRRLSETDGRRERRGRGVRRSSTKGEKGRDTFRRPSLASLSSLSSFVSFFGSPPHHLTLRAPAARRRSWSSRVFPAGRPRNDELPRARPRARSVSLFVMRTLICSTRSCRAPQAALSPLLTQLFPRCLMIDPAIMPSPS
jgi:hypothetical protein